MMRWKVRKSPAGDWWAHDSYCSYRGGLLCIMFGQCVNCKDFKKAFVYAETMARMAFIPKVPTLFQRDMLEHNRRALADAMAKGPIFKGSHNSR